MATQTVAVEKIKTSVFHRRLADEPDIVVSAKGNYLHLDNGRRILDGCGGAAVVSVGHARDDVANAIAEQARTITYAHSAAYTHGPAEQLAADLARLSGMEKVVFYSGGTEAIDCSVKLCRQYHIENGQPQRIHYIGRKRSYHGNSITTLALSHHRARRAPYEPLFPSIFHHVSPAYAYRYQHDNESTSKYVARLAAELEGKIQELGTEKVAAFYAETVVGATTGCVTAPEGYFAAMQDVCKRYGVLLVLDEIMCGMGRTGKMFAYEWEGIVADVVIVGKALASGYIPLSAVLLSSSVVATFRQGSGAFNNGHTFQSHVLACRAAHKVQEIIRHDNLVEHCKSQGAILERLLRYRFSSHPYVGDIRGRGLFWGMEFVLSKQDKTCFPVEIPLADLIEAACRASGLAVYPGGKGTFDGVVGDHILIAPPYTVETHEIEEIVDKLEAALKAVFDGLKLT